MIELPEPLTIKKLLVNHPSMPFNPDIATTFFRAGLIEAWGRGTIKILEECKKHNLPTPVFTNEFSGLQITFKGKKASRQMSGKMSGKASGKMSGKASGKTSGKILDLISENNAITIPELSSKIGVTERTIERNLKKLQEQKKLARIGGAKGGHWN